MENLSPKLTQLVVGNKYTVMTMCGTSPVPVPFFYDKRVIVFS